MKQGAYIKKGIKTLIDAVSVVKNLKKQNINKNVITLYFDMVKYRVVDGYDFDDFITFEFWRKTEKERRAYLSFRDNSKIALTITPPDIVKLFLDKKLFNIRYSHFIKREWMQLQDLSKEEIFNFIKRNKSIIVKPLDDYGGVGIRKISYAEADIYTIVEDLYEMAHSLNGRREWLIEECIENREEIRRLAPGSLNTIRIVTIIDSNGNVHVPAALLRMGSGTSIMDNYHSGGIACPIDIESGTLTAEGTGEYNKKYTVHPYSKIEFRGYKIPDFKKILDMAREIALLEPSARYVGWDFALTPNGIEVLEGNIPPGEHITQIASGPINDKIHKWLLLN